MSKRKNAIIRVSAKVLGVALTSLAAMGGATGNAPLAGATAFPAALLSSGLIESLLDKGEEETLELPPPPWWGHGDREWLAICSELEASLPTIVVETATHLRLGNQWLTATDWRETFTHKVRENLPERVLVCDRVLVTEHIAPLLLQKLGQVAQSSLRSLQEEALAQVLYRVATLLEDAYTDFTLSSPAASVQVIDSEATPIPNAIVELERKRRENSYDAYMIYAQADEVEVLKIGEQLKEKGILPWFAEIDSEPGTMFREKQATQIANVPSAAVFVGQGAIDRGQELQIYSFIDQYVERACRLIPVTLPGTKGKPQFGVFLAGFTGVDFRWSTPEPLGRLIWGITGKRPM